MISQHIEQFDMDLRRLTVRRYAIVAAILAAIALSNAFSERANFAGFGDALPLWQPLVWEFSSAILIGALIFHHRVQTTGFEPVSFSIKI